jgi:hypothetical protein
MSGWRQIVPEIDNGGPAFPAVNHHTYRGMSLRDYFMAHAPAEPQHWFSPVMTEPAPVQLQFREAPAAVQKELEGVDYEEWCDPVAMSPEAREWHERRVAAKKALHRWNAEAEKQRYVQWPAAWADEQLKARKA